MDNDSLKFAAVTKNRTPIAFRSMSLLWSNTVLHALCQSDIPKDFGDRIISYVETSIPLICMSSDIKIGSGEEPDPEMMQTL